MWRRHPRILLDQRQRVLYGARPWRDRHRERAAVPKPVAAAPAPMVRRRATAPSQAQPGANRPRRQRPLKRSGFGGLLSPSQPAPIAAGYPSAPPPPSATARFKRTALSADATACMNEQKSAGWVPRSRAATTSSTRRRQSRQRLLLPRPPPKFEKNDLDGAIGDYSQALKFDASDVDYLTSRARSLRRQERCRSRARRLQPADQDQSEFDPWPTTIAARPISAVGDFARAAADHGEVTKLQPNNPDAWSARCWVRAVSGQTQQALSDCEQAIKVKADSADVLDTRGFVYLKLNQFDNAIKDYDAALKRDPKLPARCTGAAWPRPTRRDRKRQRRPVAACESNRDRYRPTNSRSIRHQVAGIAFRPS